MLLSKNIFGKSIQICNLRVSQHLLSTCSLLKSPTYSIIPQMRSNFSTKGASIVPKLSSLPFKFLSDGTGNGVTKLPPAQYDATTSVYLENPPPQHEEDKDAAAYLGVNHFYRSGGLTSFCLLKFEAVNDTPLDNYIETTKLDFYSKIPYGTVSRVDLAPSVTSHLKALESESMESAALFFDKKRVPMELQRPAELSYILKTPGGFWVVSCHSTFFNLSTHKDSLFAAMIQSLRIELKKKTPITTTIIKAAVSPSVSEIPIIEETGALEKSKSKAKNASSKAPKKRPSKGSKLTHEANIGNINLTNPKDDFTIDDDGMMDF